MLAGSTNTLSCTTIGSSCTVVPPRTEFSMNSGRPLFLRLASAVSRSTSALAIPAYALMRVMPHA
jgi:hypothetical protein